MGVQERDILLNTLRPEQNGCHFANGFSKCIFLNEFIRFFMPFKWSLFHRVQMTTSQHWFKQWTGDKPWASYQIRKIAGCACAENAGNVFPRRRIHRKPLVSDPGMHHGTCVTHVPWCMSGSLTCGDGENFPGIPAACAPAILRI